MAEFLAFSLVVVLFVLMVVAPLVGRAFGLMGAMRGAYGGRLAAQGPRGGSLALPAPKGWRAAKPRPAPPDSRPRPVPGGRTAQAEAETADPGSALDPVRIEGRVRASAVKRIEEIVGNHPDETLAILRAWMH